MTASNTSCTPLLRSEEPHSTGVTLPAMTARRSADLSSSVPTDSPSRNRPIKPSSVSTICSTISALAPAARAANSAGKGPRAAGGPTASPPPTGAAPPPALPPPALLRDQTPPPPEAGFPPDGQPQGPRLGPQPLADHR